MKFKTYNRNIIFINKEDIERPLKSMDFLDKIEVKKKYPNSIVITIFETKPIGIHLIYRQKIQ